MPTIGFTTPAFLFGMLLAALPIIIHLINRRRARRIPFAATYFVQLSNRKLARSLKLKQLLLLLLRTLLLLLLPLLLARPYRVPPSAPIDATSSEPTNRVIVLDRSLSMQAELDGDSLFERARARVRDLVTTFPSQDMTALLPAPLSGKLEPVTLDFDRYPLLEALDTMKPSMLVTDFSRALDQARVMLEGASLKRHQVYLVGDMTQIGYDRDFVFAIDGAPVPITLVDVRDGETLPNRAIGDIEIERSFFTGLNDWKVSFSVFSYGEESRGLPVTIRSESQELASGFVDVPENESASKSFIVRFGDTGNQQIIVRIPDDALLADNVRYGSVAVSRGLKALLVNGRPSTTRHLDEVFYLQEALNPGGMNHSRIQPVVITPERLATYDLSDIDLVYLANVAELSPDTAHVLMTFVASGGGLFVAAGPTMDVDSYNTQIGELLPGRLRGARLAGTGTDTKQAGQVVYLSALDYTHPAFRVFNDDTAHSLYIAPIRHYLTFDADATRKKQILARYSDNSPALTIVQHGQGRVLLFASSVSREWNDLPIQPGFVPLMQELARFLAGQDRDSHDRTLLVGERPTAPAGVEKPVLITPEGQRLKPAAKGGGDSAPIFAPLTTPGVYRLLGGEQEWALVVNVDTRESDLRQLSAERRAEVFGGQAVALAGADGVLPEQRIEYAGLLVLLLLLAFAGEVLVLRWMG